MPAIPVRTRQALVVLLLAGMASAQDNRATLLGVVTDQSGSLVPGASVSATNIETNVRVQTETNDQGNYVIPYLNAGSYRLVVEREGFKSHQRGPIELRVADRVRVDVSIELGSVSESVIVKAESPLLDVASASAGRVIDNREVSQLPTNSLNPFLLTALSPGMQWTGNPALTRPFDNGGTSSFNAAGGVGQNEYSIDGALVTGTNRRVGFVPPADAVAEFKLETAPFDAAYGHSSGAFVNLMIKAGTNSYHGALYNQHWQKRWNATPHFARLQWDDAVRRGLKSPTDPKQPSGRSNNFGFTIGGPVRVPKVFNGRDKLFFFFSYGGIRTAETEVQAANTNMTVPKLAWRNGDFADLLAIDATRYTIYDPRSARLVNGRVTRTPFPGNRGVPVLNPTYSFYSKLYPNPNDVPGLVGADGTLNYLNAAMPNRNVYDSLINRIDYNLGDKHRFYGTWMWNYRDPDVADRFYETAPGLHSSGTIRGNSGATVRYLWIPTTHSTLEFGVSGSQFREGTKGGKTTDYKPSSAGLPAYLDVQAGGATTLPAVGFANITEIGLTYPGIQSRGSTAETRVSGTTLRNRHSMSYGWQERRYWFAQESLGYSSGRFFFDNRYMRATDITNTASQQGLEWAAFMMGLPASATISKNDTGYFSTPYRGFYFQDDIRLSTRLNVNAGVRYEREGGITERFGRGIAGGFDFNYRPFFAEAVEAAYAANPQPELPLSQFKVLGGTTYLGQGASSYTNGTHALLLRGGAAYQINSKTVLRAGYGKFNDTLNANNTRPPQNGYSQTTSTVLSTDQGLTFCCGVGAAGSLTSTLNPMADPFPVRPDNTRFDTPLGNSLGGLILQGRGWSFTPATYRPDRQHRWRAGLQREVYRRTVLDISYNGSYSRTWRPRTVSYLARQYWATGNARNAAAGNEMLRQVPNPFYIGNFSQAAAASQTAVQYLSGTALFSSRTIAKHTLLRAYPNMNGLSGMLPGTTVGESSGRIRYHDLQVLLERRFTSGFHSSVMYTYAASRLRANFLNEFDLEPMDQPNNTVRPHRFVWVGIWELPLGKGKRWASRGLARHIAGGWQLSWIYQAQSGPTVSWGNLFFYGDLAQLKERLRTKEVRSSDIHLWFDPSVAYTGTGPIPTGFVGFEGRAALQPAPYQVRTFPLELDFLRADGIRNWDVKVQRRFAIREGLSAQVSVDSLNATNHTNFGNPVTGVTNVNFGRVTSQNGLSRMIQVNLRLEF